MSSLQDRLADAMPSWMKEAARLAATRIGCKLGGLPGVDVLGSHLREVLASQRIDTVLDVGAHVGQYGRFLRNLGFRGGIISFEPVKDNFARLQRMAAGDSRWLTLPYALGRTNEQVMLNVARISQFSSMLPTSTFSAAEFGAAAEVVRQEQVGLRKLDSLIESGEVPLIGSRALLKMDTQGYDLEVIGGAHASLDCVQALQSEVSAMAIYDGMPGLLESIRQMSELGFDLSGLFTVNRDAKLRVIEFDCVMIKRPAAPPDGP